MTERIIDFLDALVATVGAVDKRYCLVEKRADVNGTNIPYKYKGNGNYAVVNVDGGSVSYWRIVNSISFDVVDGNKAVKNLQASYPIRYVAMVRRDDINPLTFSQDVANVLEGRNKDLQTQLQAKNVNITVGSIDTDTVKIWGEEFTMPLTEPNYTRSMVMIDLTVTVIAARSCWESCDDFPDILQGFDWCDPSTYQRLTPAQIACLEGFLCGTCADATVQLNGTTVGTIESGDTESFTVNLDGSPSGSWDGTAWQVTSPPCDDATIELNGVEMTTIPSGDTENITVLQSSGATQVGSKQGTHWRIDDSAISINGSPVADVKAEDALDIDVTQGGSPVGSWDGSAWIVPPCATETITVAVYSDAAHTTPITEKQFGQTVYIKSVATYAAVSYLFIARLGDDFYFIDENGTGEVSWDIDAPAGNIEIIVIADDEVSNLTDFTITGLLLDIYPITGSLYSLILEKSTYTGPLAIIKRVSDNSTASFYPNSNGRIDMDSEDTSGQTLSTFVGSGAFEVTTLFDQNSGGALFTTVGTAMPQLGDSGAVREINGQPVMYFNGVNKRLGRSQGFTDNTWSCFCVIALDNILVGSIQSILAQYQTATVNRLVICQYDPSINRFTTFFNNGSSYTGIHSAIPTTSLTLLTSIAAGDDYQLGVNGSMETVIIGQSLTPQPTGLTLGELETGTGDFKGHSGMLLVTQEDLSADVAGINNYIKNRYSIA